MAKKLKKKAKAKAKKPARKVKARAAAKRKAAPKKKAKKAAPKKKRAATSKVADSERKRLAKEQHALERDVENDEPKSTMNESPEYIPGALDDELAKEMGEAAVSSATSGAQADEDIRDEDLPEEEGGPFVQTSARQEFADGTDGSNPEDAEPAAFPTANRAR